MRSPGILHQPGVPPVIQHCGRTPCRATDNENEEGTEKDSTNVELFRQSLIKGWGASAIGSGKKMNDQWTRLVDAGSLRPGDVLLADPAAFLKGYGTSDAGPNRVGLRSRIPEDRGARNILRLLPVVLLTHMSDDGAAEGVWLTMRTGQLLGDYIDHFHTRPLHYGGPADAELTMIHPYPQVPESQPLGQEGLYLGGDFAGAQTWVEDGEGSSLRFRFFVNRVRWAPGELAAELAGAPSEAGGAEVTAREPGIPFADLFSAIGGNSEAPDRRCWLPVRCSMDLVLAEADSLDSKPLWVQLAELEGKEVAEVGRAYNLLD